MPADGLEAQDVVPGHFRRGDRFLGKAHTLARRSRNSISITTPPPGRLAAAHHFLAAAQLCKERLLVRQ